MAAAPGHLEREGGVTLASAGSRARHGIRADFLTGVPHEPGVYRIYAPPAVYSTSARRGTSDAAGPVPHDAPDRRDRKRRALVRAAERIEWQAWRPSLKRRSPRSGSSRPASGAERRRRVSMGKTDAVSGSGAARGLVGGAAASVRASRPCLARSGLSSQDASRPGSGTSSDMAHRREGRADLRTLVTALD